MEATLYFLARNGMSPDVRKMIAVADANGFDLVRSKMRLVDPDLTPYEAKTKFPWRGTFVEMRLGSILAGAANPKDAFAIWFPDERRQVNGSLTLTRISVDHQ